MFKSNDHSYSNERPATNGLKHHHSVQINTLIVNCLTVSTVSEPTRLVEVLEALIFYN